jgi:hypothetical protein
MYSYFLSLLWLSFCVASPEHTMHVLHWNCTVPVTHVSQIMTNRKLQKRCHEHEDGCYDKKNNWFYRKFVVTRYWHGFTWSLLLVNLRLHVFQWSRRSTSTPTAKQAKTLTPEIGRYIVLYSLMASSVLLKLSWKIIMNSKHGLQIKRPWSIIQVLSCTS